MNGKFTVLLYSVVLLGLTGCAFTEEQITLQHTPSKSAVSVAGAKNVTVDVQVIDRRSEKTKVGSKKNGFGAETAPIIATQEVAVTVRKAIEQELIARGFVISSEQALVQVSGSLIRFYNDHKMGFFAGDAVADLNMDVTVKSKEGSVLYAKQVNVQGVEKNIQMLSGENARIALNRALENGMNVLFEDQAFVSALVASLPRP